MKKINMKEAPQDVLNALWMKAQRFKYAYSWTNHTRRVDAIQRRINAEEARRNYNGMMRLKEKYNV